MKNIVIKKTVNYGVKGEVLLEKNGRITIEALDPKSLRQIMEYVKNNFYKLEEATIDEDNFTFKYGNYKIMFEFYRSYDFIRENVKSLKNVPAKKLSFINRYDLVIDFGKFKLRLNDYSTNIEINELLSKLKSKKQNIAYHIKGNNLFTKIDDVTLELKDYKKFISDKNFKYIFEKIKNKKIKVIKDTILLGALVLSSSIGVTTLITDAKAEVATKEIIPEKTIEISIPMPTESIEEFTTIETVYVDSEAETLTTTKEEITAEIEPKTEPLINNESDKYEELGVGTLVNDEKALTTKRLYFDIIEKYATKYGLDSELVLAIATQERGVHSNQIDEGGAIGLMQVQVDVWKDKSLTVFDYEQNKEVTITFTMDKISSLEGNIEAGCVILQHYKNIVNGNNIALIQSYNNGPYAVGDMMDKYSNFSGKTREEIISENDLGWLDYRTSAYAGDPDYVENVLRYYQGDMRNLEPDNGIVMS